MDRQPLIPLALLALLGCTDDEIRAGAFDQPGAAAVVHPEDHGGPFREPIGLVASGHGGLIHAIALKQGRFLTDDPTASFLRGNGLPTGANRLLTSIAGYAPDEQTVTLFAGDEQRDVLIELPYVIGVEADGSPTEQRVSYTEPTFVDADSSGDAPELTAFAVRNGYAATEAWTVYFDGETWWVTGTRSGKQENRAFADEVYLADNGAFTFVLEGEATAGDYFTFETDNGLVEHQVGGSPQALAMSPDQSTLAMVVYDEAEAEARVRFFDPADATVSAWVELPDGAQPERLAWTEDGALLWIADAELAMAHAVTWDGESASVESIELPWALVDLAPLTTSDGVEQLYVAPKGMGEVWVLDLETLEWVDINTNTTAVEGMALYSPVMGLEAVPMAYRWPEQDDHGAYKTGKSVAVSLYSGEVLWMEEGTGCLLQDSWGPRTVATTDFGSRIDYGVNFDGYSLGPTLLPNVTNTRHVQVNQCGGVSPGERWDLVFDAGEQGWIVEGSISGIQDAIAYEDQRYLSDNGEISFTIRAGMTASQHGWRMLFYTLDGVLSADGDNDGDDTRDVVFDGLGDPVYFHYRVGPTGGGWDPIDERTFVLVPSASSDMVARVANLTGEVEVTWE